MYHRERSNIRKRGWYRLNRATRPLGYCLQRRPFRCSAPISTFHSFQQTLENHQPRLLFNVQTILPRRRTRIVLTLSSSSQGQSQQMRDVMGRQTYLCDLCLWRERAFRLDVKRGYAQDVCEAGAQAPMLPSVQKMDLPWLSCMRDAAATLLA